MDGLRCLIEGPTENPNRQIGLWSRIKFQNSKLEKFWKFTFIVTSHFNECNRQWLSTAFEKSKYFCWTKQSYVVKKLSKKLIENQLDGVKGLSSIVSADLTKAVAV